jgi:hypothetical protein
MVPTDNCRIQKKTVDLKLIYLKKLMSIFQVIKKTIGSQTGNAEEHWQLATLIADACLWQ